MKYFKLATFTIVILLFSVYHAAAMGFLPLEDWSEPQVSELSVSDEIATEVDFQKCLPHKPAPDEICYISGGIGSDEVSQFKSRAKEYLLEIVFVQKTNLEDSGRVEAYLAEVDLQIKDSKGNVVVNTTTEGPFFLADLPLGTYQITANLGDVMKKNTVKIIAKKHQRIVFLWPG